MNSDLRRKILFPYILTLVGVAPATIAAISGFLRSLVFAAAFRGGFAARRQFGAMNPFGLFGGLEMLGLAVAVVGLIWLGLTLWRSGNGTPGLA